MFLIVSCQRSSICNQHVSDENLTDLGLCLQLRPVKFTIWPSMEVDSVSWCSEGMLYHDCEVDAKEGGGKHTPLLDSTPLHWMELMMTHQTGWLPSYPCGITRSHSEAFVDIQSLQGLWRGCRCSLCQRPLSGLWLLCRVTSSDLCIFSGAVIGKTSCQSWSIPTWSHIVTGYIHQPAS